MIVHDLALRPDREVGGNEPRAPCELTTPLGHFSNHRAPLKAVCRPEDVSQLVMSLIEGADLVTGECIVIDGGVGIAG